MKDHKFKALIEDVEDFVATWQMENHHRIFFEDVQEHFPHVKKKHLKLAIKEVIDL